MARLGLRPARGTLAAGLLQRAGRVRLLLVCARVGVHRRSIVCLWRDDSSPQVDFVSVLPILAIDVESSV